MSDSSRSMHGSHSDGAPRFRMLDPYERRFFGGVLLILLCGWGFVALADNVMDGETQSFDERVLLALRHPDDPGDPLGSESWEEVGRDITALGGYAFLTILFLGVCGFLALSGRRQMLRFLVVAVVGGFIVTMGLKSAFQRPRPDVVAHRSYAGTTSFPSGHSMMSMVVFLTMGALLARICKTRTLKLYCLVFALSLSILVGCSRVYMGVHYPTDVMAGWSGGLIWATLSCLVASWLERRGVIGLHEHPLDEIEGTL